MEETQENPTSTQSEERKPDILDGILTYQKKEVINVDHYPVDVQEIVEFVGTKWGFNIPGKGKKDENQKVRATVVKAIRKIEEQNAFREI